jgi:hypothetical protein
MDGDLLRCMDEDAVVRHFLAKIEVDAPPSEEYRVIIGADFRRMLIAALRRFFVVTPPRMPRTLVRVEDDESINARLTSTPGRLVVAYLALEDQYRSTFGPPSLSARTMLMEHAIKETVNGRG